MLTLLLFPLKQWLHKRASMLQYTYIACLVSIQFVVLLSFDTVLSRAWIQIVLDEPIACLQTTKHAVSISDCWLDDEIESSDMTVQQSNHGHSRQLVLRFVNPSKQSGASQ